MNIPVRHPFPLTHWTLVRQAGSEDLAARRKALQILLARYQPVLVSYLEGSRRMPQDQAQDLVQSFITEQMLEYGLIAHADRTKGRFRTLLLASLNNFVVSQFRKERKHRATAELPDDLAGGATSTVLVDAEWTRTLVRDVLFAMQEECIRTHRQDIWDVFQSRIVTPLFEGRPAPDYRKLSATLKLGSPTQAANLLVTGKRMYSKLLRAAIAEYEKSDVDIDAELQDLHRILSAAARS